MQSHTIIPEKSLTNNIYNKPRPKVIKNEAKIILHEFPKSSNHLVRVSKLKFLAKSFAKSFNTACTSSPGKHILSNTTVVLYIQNSYSKGIGYPNAPQPLFLAISNGLQNYSQLYVILFKLQFKFVGLSYDV